LFDYSEHLLEIDKLNNNDIVMYILKIVAILQ